MKLRNIIVIAFTLAAVGAFLFLPDRGEFFAFGFAVLAAALVDLEAVVGGLRSWRGADDD